MVSVCFQMILLLVTAFSYFIFLPRILFAALLAYWVTTLMLILFRPTSPGSIAVGFIKYGFVLLYLSAKFLDQLFFGD